MIKLTDIIKDILKENILPTTLAKLRPDYVGKIHLPTLPIQYIMDFKNSAPDDFSALRQAEDFLVGRKYIIGRLEGDFPIGFVKPSRGITYIAKWTHISPNEMDILDGVILSKDFREGPVQVAFFADE